MVNGRHRRYWSPRMPSWTSPERAARTRTHRPGQAQAFAPTAVHRPSTFNRPWLRCERVVAPRRALRGWLVRVSPLMSGRAAAAARRKVEAGASCAAPRARLAGRRAAPSADARRPKVHARMIRTVLIWSLIGWRPRRATHPCRPDAAREAFAHAMRDAPCGSTSRSWESCRGGVAGCVLLLAIIPVRELRDFGLVV